MAQQENDNRMREGTEAYKQSIQREVDSVMMEAERQKKLQTLDRQINTLAERALAFEDQYGADDYRTQIMTIFLEVTLEMKSTIDLLSDVGVALQCIGQAIGCIDDVLNMQQEFLNVSLEQKYGFFERMRRKRKMRKAMRNNVARMQQMAEMLIGSQKMAMSVVSALRSSCVKMKAVAEKNFQKQAKRDQKMKSQDGASAQPSLARKLMDEMRAKQNGNGAGSGSGSGSGGGTGNGAGASTTSGPAGNGGSSSTDDISDIL